MVRISGLVVGLSEACWIALFDGSKSLGAERVLYWWWDGTLAVSMLGSRYHLGGHHLRHGTSSEAQVLGMELGTLGLQWRGRGGVSGDRKSVV